MAGLSFLKFLLCITYQQMKEVLYHITNEQLEAIGKFCYNILHGKIDTALIKIIKRHRTVIRQLSNRSKTEKQRRRILRGKINVFMKIFKETKHIIP